MKSLSALLFLIGIAGLTISIIKPSSLAPVLKDRATTKTGSTIFGIIALTSFTLNGNYGTLLGLFCLLGIIGLIVSIIKPSSLAPVLKDRATTKTGSIFFGTMMIMPLFLAGYLPEDSGQIEKVESTSTSESKSSEYQYITDTTSTESTTTTVSNPSKDTTTTTNVPATTTTTVLAVTTTKAPVTTATVKPTTTTTKAPVTTTTMKATTTTTQAALKADYNCSDFSSQAQAQSFFNSNNPSSDPYRLDQDGDGIACESL